jgi:hypothetical protein
MGFDDRDELLEQYKRENAQLRDNNSNLSGGISASNMVSRNPDNIRYQLDAQEIKLNIERFLRGDEIVIDSDGNEIYKRQTNPEIILFNEYGINLIMSKINPYVDKGTFLSYYSEERINEILADIGDLLTDEIFCNYDKMGMISQYKKSRYELVVMTILHMIESGYRRAIGGKEREEINSSRIYMPNQMGGYNQNQQIQRKKFNLFNWKTW